MTSKLILLFDTDNLKDILGQLGEADDLNHIAGKLETMTTAFVVKQPIYDCIEEAIAGAGKLGQHLKSFMYRGRSVIAVSDKVWLELNRD